MEVSPKRARRFMMSIRPKFGEQILGGRKRYELRRMVAGLIEPGDLIYLYFSRPVSAVVGLFSAGVVYVAPPENLEKIAELLGDVGLGEEDWLYVRGARCAMLIEVRSPSRCARPLKLAELGLRPPPSYMRLSPSAARRLHGLCI